MKAKRILPVLLLVTLLSVIFVVPVMAAPLHPVHLLQEAQPFEPLPFLILAFNFVLGSATIAGSAAFLVNIAKQLGLKDGHAISAVSIFNTVLILGVFFYKLYNPNADLKIIEDIARLIIEKGPALIIPLLPILIWISKWINDRVKGAFLVGYSHTLAKSK